MVTAATRSAPASLRLHVPDEPEAGRELWYGAVLDGAPIDEVLTCDGGVIDWLWARWSVLARSGFTPESFESVVLGYRREIWLWLAGERTWDQCCSELIGRVVRRAQA